ncbi:AarF/ABC1/UbiB kinase family protein [Gloeocapsa sp. PCC 73106]|uniref:ABC1 kinase family protein n=1 Tax=Gloeocapsa sp. PCC 73106 TaxID=102232 RepID=UPI0002ACA002|nr:AarF/ABC1/UbiB kinase family protein [Gloeocapsa sp. PCC 73106]ELR99012.1 putative unusual protein kinase [Gloeocapsa sp. PCC 73106]
MFALTQYTNRQREIIEVVLRNGWDYMRGILTGSKPDEPQLPTPEVLRKILIELGPVYVKLGQLLSTRPDLLPADYIEALSALQAKVPSVPWEEIEEQIEEQLPETLSMIFSKINPEAIAAGSIGQVHRATLRNGQEVALKVQRPKIDLIVDQDIALIKAMAELVALTDFGKDYDIIALADEFTTALKAELDFTREGTYTEQLRTNLAKSDWFDPSELVVPKIHWDLTSSKLLVMEWLDGVPLLSAKFLDPQQEDQQRKEITTLLFRVFFQQIYVDGFFHADPHPGNLFYLHSGQVALLDCGMIGRLDPRTQNILIEMLLAIVDLDAQRCSELTLDLSDTNTSTSLIQLQNDYDRMLRKYHNLSISEINFSEVFYEVLAISRRNKIRLPGNMGLYVKTIANLEGVARSFYPKVNLLEEVKPLITDVFRRRLIGDNPATAILRTALDLKNLSLRSPRKLDLLLERVTSETLIWNISIQNLDYLRKSIDDSANRLSFSIVVGSLIIGAAIISANSETSQVSLATNILFAAASFLGLWLIISILRSGKLK